MNSKQKSKGWGWMTVLVAFATLVSAGAVAADHIEMPVYSETSALARFEQYMWASNWTEMEREHAAMSIDARMSRLDRFGQYLLALELGERTHAFPVADDMSSGEGYWCVCYDLMYPGSRETE